MMRASTARIGIVCLILVTLLGCFSGRVRRPSSAPSVPHGRMVIVEFADHPPYSGTGMRFSRVLKEKISESTDQTDVVIVDPGDIAMRRSDRTLQRGRIALKTLEITRRRFGGDTLLIGEITHYDPYSGPSVGIHLKAFSTANAEMLESLSERWNSASPALRKPIRRYYQRNRARDECRFGPNMFLTSPRYFLLFVADQIVRDHLLPAS